MKRHVYHVRVKWTGNEGEGTKTYHGYRRDHVINVEGKPDILASSDPSFRGDATRYNPEDLFVSSLSTCHMLWYLHLCAVNGIAVTDYHDDAEGYMDESSDGSGAFVRVLLRPKVTIAEGGDRARARELHASAHRFCFIAKSVNFPVECEATISVTDPL